MTDNVQTSAADTADNNTKKLECAMGGLNIALGGVLFADGIILAIIAFVCLLMSFSLFFMAAIPVFLVIGFICIMAFFASILNIVTGIMAVISSKKQWNTLKVSALTIAVDVAVIPANIIALICGAYLLYTEVDWLSVLIFVVAACAIMLAIASLVLSAVLIVKRK